MWIIIFTFLLSVMRLIIFTFLGRLAYRKLVYIDMVTVRTWSDDLWTYKNGSKNNYHQRITSTLLVTANSR